MFMFDWPEQSQTSPTSRSLMVTVLSPVSVMVKGPPAVSGSRCTDHVPPAAVVLAF
jgi:hypothetical protein